MRKNHKNKWRTDLPQVSKVRGYLGIILGLLYAFLFYSFLFVTREILRCFTLTDTYELWILTQTEFEFFNLFSAYLSIMIGQSIAFLFTFDIPKSKLGTNSLKKRFVINDQRNLIWYFLAWSSKVAMIYLSFVTLAHGDSHTTSFFHDYDYLFVLVILVLFFHSWQTIRILFLRDSLKWMFISFFIISILSIALSRIHVVDHNKFNQQVSSKNLRLKYNISFTSVDMSLVEKVDHRALAKIHLVKNDSSIFNNDYRLFFNQHEVSFQELNQLLNTVLKMHPIAYPHHSVLLYSDSSASLSTLNQLKEVLRANKIYKLSFSVTLNDTNVGKHFSDLAYKIRLIGYNEFSKAEKIQFEAKSSNIKISKGGKYLIQNRVVHQDSLTKKIQNQISRDSSTSFTFRYNETISVDQYLKVITNYHKAINNLRELHAQNTYHKSYNYLTRSEKGEIKKQVPHVIFEIPRLEGY